MPMGQKYIFVVITAVTTARKEVCEKKKITFQLEITNQVLVLQSNLNSPCHGKNLTPRKNKDR